MNFDIFITWPRCRKTRCAIPADWRYFAYTWPTAPSPITFLFSVSIFFLCKHIFLHTLLIFLSFILSLLFPMTSSFLVGARRYVWAVIARDPGLGPKTRKETPTSLLFVFVVCGFFLPVRAYFAPFSPLFHLLGVLCISYILCS